jgi:hypothetical protein
LLVARARAELEETSRSVEEAQKALRAKDQTSQETIKKKQHDKKKRDFFSTSGKKADFSSHFR